MASSAPPVDATINRGEDEATEGANGRARLITGRGDVKAFADERQAREINTDLNIMVNYWNGMEWKGRGGNETGPLVSREL